jgi:DNA polymerase-3 subunit gamma/tau
MSQLALARKYRPRDFRTLIGQETTVQALKNALDNQRLHHAYLFTGTRGVGKTTIARILAKCLNCEQGISSLPCGQCNTCLAIDAGRLVDLIEVDAASRTKVEDTRELLDNVQYLPTQGRFKVYLIDEVHMLSGHSFNALLKTLEEPPSHVKFLLATTDPQKLPVTILSRCLQFHLRRVPLEKIISTLADILQQEGCSFELEALQELARAADGSLRDALSLLDQALSYGNGQITAIAVRSLLGIPEKMGLLELLTAVAEGNSKRVLQKIQGLSEKITDFSGLLSELLNVLHQLAMAQSCPEVLDENMRERQALLTLAEQISPQEIQLYYQIGLHGNRDLPFAPNPQIGFEMALLRMVAFQPVRVGGGQFKEFTESKVEKVERVDSGQFKELAEPKVEKVERVDGGQFKEVTEPKVEKVERIDGGQFKEVTEPKVEKVERIDGGQFKELAEPKVEKEMLSQKEVPNQLEQPKQLQKAENPKVPELLPWNILIEKLNLSGLTKVLAENCIFVSFDSDVFQLILDESQKPLMTPRYEERLQVALAQYLERPVRLKISLDKVSAETPSVQKQRLATAKQQNAHQAIETDLKIQDLIQTFNATVEQISLKEE